MSIGQRLKEARKFRGISQDILAEQIGSSRGVITNIEHDKIAYPQPIVVNAICQTLRINSEWLLRGIGTMEANTPPSHNTKTLSDIYMYAQKLSEKEQLFFLDMMKSYIEQIKN